MIAWSDDDLDAREFPDEGDLADDDDDGVLGRVRPCSYCGVALSEQAQQCPHCKQWLPSTLGSWRDAPRWYVRGGLWATKMLLWNWLFWIGLTALAVLAWIFAR